jgi:hypothetical protein
MFHVLISLIQCELHGVYLDRTHPQGRRGLEGFVRHADEAILLYEDNYARRLKVGRVQKSPWPGPDKPCSTECFQAKRERSRAPRLNQEIIDVLRACMVPLSREPRAACMIAPFLNTPCWQIHMYITKEMIPPPPPQRHFKGNKTEWKWYNIQKQQLYWLSDTTR